MTRPQATRGLTRLRLLDAAVDLFAKHGVHATSLQMIADRLGVGKGAVYHQFHSKDEIALSVVLPVLADIDRVIRIAELLPTRETRQDVAVSGLIELVIRHRRVSSFFYSDPTIHQLLEKQDEYQDITARFTALLLGPDPDPAGLAAITLLTAGIYAAATDPRLVEVDDAELRRILLDCSAGFLRRTDQRAAAVAESGSAAR